MKLILYLSDMIIPLLFFYIIGYGILSKQHIYEDFIQGAQDGLKTVVKIVPTMIGLMTGVGILRASGFLDFLGNLFGRFTDRIGFPGDLLPLWIVKLFSSSAATGLLLDIYKEFGTDSKTGLIASLFLSSTETVFYTMSIYFVTVKISRTRYTLPGAMLAILAATAASVFLAGAM